MVGKTKTPKKAKNNHTHAVLIAAIDELLGLHKQMERMLMKGMSSNGEKPIELTPEEKKAMQYYEEGLQKTLDLIAPAGIEVQQNELLLNDMYARTFFVYNWPNYIMPNWMSQVINFDAKMDISQFIYPADSKAIMKVLRKKVTEMRSSIRMLEQRGIVRDPTLEAALQDAEELRDLLARGREKLYHLGLYVTIYSDNEEKLKKLQTDIESLMGGKLVLTKPSTFQMEHGWTSTLPVCVDELEISRNMNTSPLAACFPFSSADLTDDHGILYGINRHNDSLVIFDRFDLPNANANVFAISGAGKSFTVKLEILRSLMFNTEVFVLDPENEYSDLCKAVGGTYIPLSLQSNFRINPFDLPKAVRGEEAKRGEVLRAAVITLHGLFKIMLGTLTPAEDGILDKAILDTYALKGIALDTEDPAHMEPPTMNELIDVLMTTEGGEHMAQTLMKYTSGSYAGLFNEPTNVELGKQMIVFQIRDLEEQLRPIAMYIILNFLWNRIRADFKKRFLVIDEAWNLLQHDDSARFLYGLIKRARKYYLGVTTITQDVEDFVNSPYGKPIITNSSLQVLLKQSPTAVDNLQKLFYLTEGEKYLLLNSDVGQGLFFASNKHVAIQVIASPKEAELITTKPEEILAKKQHAQEQETDSEKAIRKLDETIATPDEVSEGKEKKPQGASEKEEPVAPMDQVIASAKKEKKEQSDGAPKAGVAPKGTENLAARKEAAKKQAIMGMIASAQIDKTSEDEELPPSEEEVLAAAAELPAQPKPPEDGKEAEPTVQMPGTAPEQKDETPPVNSPVPTDTQENAEPPEAPQAPSA